MPKKTGTKPKLKQHLKQKLLTGIKILILIMFMFMLKNQKQEKEEPLNQKQSQIITHYQIQ